MKILSLNASLKQNNFITFSSQTCYEKKKNIEKDLFHNDVFIKSHHKKISEHISFRGHPYSLNCLTNQNISAQEAIDIFCKLKLGNYLDINGNPNNSYDKSIRQKNLAFLDCVKNSSEKDKFITYYKNLTGFPNLDIVSSRIQSEFLNSVKKSEQNLKYNFGYPDNIASVATAGYDGVSSTAKGYALPGSDLDKAYVILIGSTNDSYEFPEYFASQEVSKFRALLNRLNLEVKDV